MITVVLITIFFWIGYIIGYSKGGDATIKGINSGYMATPEDCNKTEIENL